MLGERARQADRERVRRLRDQQRNINPSEDGFQGGRGDPGILPQVKINSRQILLKNLTLLCQY